MHSGAFRTEELSSGVYRELRGIAARQLARLPARTTLQPTELVHEAFLRLAAPSAWKSRAHFFGAAARAIRYALVDHLRARSRWKRYGGLRRISLSGVHEHSAGDAFGDVALREALERLDRHDSRCARVVVLRVVSGLTVPEVARALGISEATVERDWTYGRAWLYRELSRGPR